MARARKATGKPATGKRRMAHHDPETIIEATRHRHGPRERAAVTIVDGQGIESLEIIPLP